jgi:F0F1-type ATP synthase assembly protein I
MPSEIVKSYFFFATILVMLIIGFGLIILAITKKIKQRRKNRNAE